MCKLWQGTQLVPVAIITGLYSYIILYNVMEMNESTQLWTSLVMVLTKGFALCDIVCRIEITIKNYCVHTISKKTIVIKKNKSVISYINFMLRNTKVAVWQFTIDFYNTNTSRM